WRFRSAVASFRSRVKFELDDGLHAGERKIVRCGGISLFVFPRIRVFNRSFIGLAYRFSEAPDCFTERFAQFGELAWTENHQGNYKNNNQLRHTKTSEHTTPPDAITLCFGVRDVNLVADVEMWSGRPDANIVSPPSCLHEQDEAMICNGNVLEPSLPLVRVRGMFLQSCSYLLDGLRVLLLKDFV